MTGRWNTEDPVAEKRDYYEVLGVAKNCGEEELKKAYRKKAKQCHPDLRPGDKQAEEEFKELNEAYGVLSDPQKRQQYDQFGFAGVDGAGFGDFNASDFGFDFSDILGSIFGGGFGRGFGGGRSMRNAPRRGADLKYRMSLEFMEAAFGVERDITIKREEQCHSCNGSGAKAGTQPETCSACHGSGVVQRQQQTFFGVGVVQVTCDRCGGTGKIIKDPCDHCHGAGREVVSRTLHVKVPAGIDNGEMLPLRGEGEAGYNGGPTGDLYVAVTIKPHPVFRRERYNTFCEVPITFAQAALGGEIEVPTIHGKEKYVIREGTQPGDIITMKGRGIPYVDRPGMRGDHIVTLNLEVPRHLDEDQKRAIREFDTSCKEENYHKRRSFITKLRDLFN